MIAIAIPTYGPVSPFMVGPLLSVGAEARLIDKVAVLHVDGVASFYQVRQVLLEKALSVGADRLLFMDSDVIPPAGGISKLAEVKAEVVAGFYYRRNPEVKIPTWKKGNQPFWSCEPEVEIDGCGMGFTLIDLRFVREHLGPDMWEPIPPIIGEDYAFCERVRRSGGKIIGRGDVRCGHLTWHRIED